MVQIRLVCLVAVALTATGCGGNMNKYLRKQAGIDLNCSESQVHLSTITRAGAQYLAEACGRRAVYTYSRDQGAVRISAVEGANAPGTPLELPPAGGGDPTPPPPPPPPPRP